MISSQEPCSNSGFSYTELNYENVLNSASRQLVKATGLDFVAKLMFMCTKLVVLGKRNKTEVG